MEQARSTVALETLPISEVSSPKSKPSETTVQVSEKGGNVERDSASDGASAILDEPDRLELRSAVEVADDVSMPAETFRAYAIGIFFTFIGAAISNITDLREQPLVIDPSMVQLLSLPVGRLLARWIPDIRVGFGKWSFRTNPGPFTLKEHALIVIMANVGCGYPPYAAGLLIVQMGKFSNSSCLYFS